MLSATKFQECTCDHIFEACDRACKKLWKKQDDEKFYWNGKKPMEFPLPMSAAQVIDKWRTVTYEDENLTYEYSRGFHDLDHEFAPKFMFLLACDVAQRLAEMLEIGGSPVTASEFKNYLKTKKRKK